MATTLPQPPAALEASSIPRYRQILRKSLPDHLFSPDLVNLLWLPLHFGVIALAWWLLATNFSWWLAPLCAVAVGHSIGCMGFVGHDVGHGGSIKTLWLRDLISGICFSPFWISPRLWRRWHNTDHHGHTQVEGVDPDHLFTLEGYKDNPVLKALYKLSPLLRNLVIFGSFAFRMTQQQLMMVVRYVRSPNVESREKAVILSQLALMAVAWVGVSWLIGPQVFVWGYLVPLLVANAMVISYIATNHFLNPLADEADVLATSLTVTLPRGLKWLDPWHQYFGAHVAHHLFPQAPARFARQIEAKAAELFPDRYHTMTIFQALRALWRTPWIYEDHKTFIDPEKDERHPTLGHGLKP